MICQSCSARESRLPRICNDINGLQVVKKMLRPLYDIPQGTDSVQHNTHANIAVLKTDLPKQFIFQVMFRLQRSLVHIVPLCLNVSFDSFVHIESWYLLCCPHSVLVF